MCEGMEADIVRHIPVLAASRILQDGELAHRQSERNQLSSCFHRGQCTPIVIRLARGLGKSLPKEKPASAGCNPGRRATLEAPTYPTRRRKVSSSPCRDGALPRFQRVRLLPIGVYHGSRFVLQMVRNRHLGLAGPLATQSPAVLLIERPRAHSDAPPEHFPEHPELPGVPRFAHAHSIRPRSLIRSAGAALGRLESLTLGGCSAHICNGAPTKNRTPVNCLQDSRTTTVLRGRASESTTEPLGGLARLRNAFTHSERRGRKCLVAGTGVEPAI